MSAEASPSPSSTAAVASTTEIAALAGGLAHEIRNPLSTIRMNLELLSEEVGATEDPKVRRMTTKLERIRRECLHLEDILTAFLQFARAGELQLEPTDLSAFVQEFIEVYAAEARQHDVAISPHLAADLPPVRVDPRLLRQALLNLTLNAQQAMPKGGQIEFQTYASAGRVVLAIIDTGPGMNEATRERLFQAFFSTKSNGSGLGLPTVRRIVEAHGGTIQCDSEVGKGTRFVITLPPGG
jgi:two-component system sensor histidine kinase HydH